MSTKKTKTEDKTLDQQTEQAQVTATETAPKMRDLDNLPKDMMHTFAPGRADIHAGTFSDSVETFENVNVPRLVRVVLICHKYLRKVII